jgi:hypothetical protein
MPNIIFHSTQAVSGIKLKELLRAGDNGRWAITSSCPAHTRVGTTSCHGGSIAEIHLISLVQNALPIAPYRDRLFLR